MLFTAGIIILCLQFVMDYQAITSGKTSLTNLQDILSFFLFGIIGILLLFIHEKLVQRRMRKRSETTWK